VFVRHGHSTTNKAGVFTGWMDVPLSDLGREQSKEAGRQLREYGYHFETCFTSMLARSTQTVDEILNEMKLANSCNVIKHWKLNERHYGLL
jgi:2,3-bisphosphoglycerate-dependent phosphoglycerate mutase